MGITGTEVTKEAAVMILTDDNFSTIVKAVEVGRGLYDNLARYVRFQIASLFGYIMTFLSASIFDVTRGIPLLPYQRAAEVTRPRQRLIRPAGAVGSCLSGR